MIRRPPRSTLFPLHDALPISERMRREGFRAAHRQPRSVFAEGLLQGRRFGAVAQQCGASVRVDVVDLFGSKLCIFQSVVNRADADRKSTRLNSSHANISYAVF